MRPFRFRPQTVLELRRAEEETARTALARQRAECERLQRLAEEAAGTARAAAVTLASTAAAGARPAVLEWHRSWIVALKREVTTRVAAVAAAEQAAVKLAAALNQAVQKKRVLERLRERAWRRYRVESDREHLRDMDRLAGMRHFAQAVELGGEDDDDQSAGRDLGGLSDLEPHAGRGVL